MLLLKTRDFINEKSIYKNTNKNFPILKKMQAQTIKYKEIFLFIFANWRGYKMGKNKDDRNRQITKTGR